MHNGRQEVTYIWNIENYSYCIHEKGKALLSPVFRPGGRKGTPCRLDLYPRGSPGAEEGFISLFLVREGDNGPEYVSVKFELSVLAEDGSALSSKKYDLSFGRFHSRGSVDFLKMDKSIYLKNFPRDVLTVRCKMRTGEGEVHRVAPICVRTCIGVETISFRHEVDKFSTLKPNQKHTIRIPSPLKRECFVTSSLYLTVDSCRDGEMMVEITTSDTDYFLCKRRISLLTFWNIILCREDDNRFDVERKDIQKLPLSFTKLEIINKKSEYLEGDKLILFCECSFSTNHVWQKIGETPVKMPIEAEKQRNNQEPSTDISKINFNTSTHSRVSEDIKALFVKQCFTDVKLKTKTKSFPAHKLVLCVTSPVFNRMLSIDMKEKNTGRIEVDDLGDDVVQQLLLFLYSDTVQDLEWAMATRLYYAADKYEIGRLKEVCSSFLVEHLTPTNAGELLLLADTHSDGDLKGGVEDFILNHDKEVFVSKEWEMLMETNSQLTGKTMQLKYKR
ncbi:unnamed protein product [Larinioides sclopetarius]|uniref:Speckle-type POZ protein n=1 Tax=Larinioides sclopetarius TaxID=280406 RepID=A0AAV2BHS0_9ARAC